MTRSPLRTLGAAALAVGAVGAATFAYASLIERKQFTLREFTAPVLPAGAEPIRVLHLSDLHMAAWQREKQVWLTKLAQLKPDLIVDTGDNLGHEDGLIGIRAALEPFKGVPGVYVWGSNDYFGPSPRNPVKYFTGPSRLHPKPTSLDIAGLKAYLDGLGFTDLNNTATAIEIKGTRLEFFGVDDPHRHYDDLDAAADALAGVAAEGRSVRIGVAHAPYQYVLNSFIDHGARLIFAGHTHGGQVCVPGCGALVTNCDLPRKQAKGLSMWRHQLRSAYLHVSAGLGTSIYAPVRFACKPEATLLTLVPEGQASV
ncbi:metallophosphoesterase [Gryllotalpicola protaetiae]|uniref:Metallophosphoesterase n=1 Tax=Gryllotalpicola protaetiae TaxID=2419771 RepID=A0A387BK15_9MICO|nr:metallophosphoesterase [Gryllotalpicola protaetiae]AYG04193.1 metallophosphoesterase [Gryllotalpicola protaetiae]